ncbi:helix-turn-helix domain-containing protein [Paracoccus sp. (in: a-proteobacteria)]|uniref:helix-turn-helix domain-containing protein n=1 Tax=Paracoccus sp. TaxID=267 RepID=UPI0035B0B674
MDLSSAERRLARQYCEGLRSRRKLLGYTQEDLASVIGTNRRFISELERGKGTSHLRAALAAAEALGLNISSLFEERRNAISSPLPPA